MGKQRTQRNARRGATVANGGGARAGSEDQVTAPAAASAPPEETGGLGPAVTAEFEQAVGLESLIGGDRAPRAVKELTAPSGVSGSTTPPLPSIPMLNVARMCDAMVSAFADVDREDDDSLTPLVESTQPLADYYAGSETSVTMLWLLACMGVCSYGLTKFQKYRAAHPKKAKRPDVATAASDGAASFIPEVETTPTKARRVPFAEMATPPEDRS